MSLRIRNHWVTAAITLIGILIIFLPYIPAPCSWFFCPPKDVFLSIGSAFISTSLLFFMLQTRIIAEDIERHFVAAFTDSAFVKGLTDGKRKEVIASSLRETYAGFPKDYIDRHLAILDKAHNTYIDSSVERYEISGDETKLFKSINRETTFVCGEVNGTTLLAFLKANAPLEARFETQEAVRRITKLNVRVGERDVLKLKSALLTPRTEPSESMALAFTLDWDTIDKNQPHILTQPLPAGAHVTIIMSEEREMGWSSSLHTRTFLHIVREMQVDVFLIGLKGHHIRGRLFGDSVHLADYERHCKRDHLSLHYKKWLFPGNGFALALTGAD